MACACYVIILQRILHWFVQGKADDSPVSDLLPANLHLLYHLWKPLNVDFTYKQMFFCILFHLLWLFLPTFCRPGYLFVWSWQAGEDPCPLLLLLPARSPYAVLGPWFLRAFPAWWLSFESICCHIHTFLYIWGVTTHHDFRTICIEYAHTEIRFGWFPNQCQPVGTDPRVTSSIWWKFSRVCYEVL